MQRLHLFALAALSPCALAQTWDQHLVLADMDPYRVGGLGLGPGSMVSGQPLSNPSFDPAIHDQVHVFERGTAGAGADVAELENDPPVNFEPFGIDVTLEGGALFCANGRMASAARFEPVAGAWTRVADSTKEAGVFAPAFFTLRVAVLGDQAVLTDRRGLTVLPRSTEAEATVGCTGAGFPYLDVRGELRLSNPTLTFGVLQGSSLAGSGVLVHGLAPATPAPGALQLCVGGPLARTGFGGPVQQLPGTTDFEAPVVVDLASQSIRWAHSWSCLVCPWTSSTDTGASRTHRPSPARSS